jgi:hypothetical protein
MSHNFNPVHIDDEDGHDTTVGLAASAGLIVLRGGGRFDPAGARALAAALLEAADEAELRTNEAEAAEAEIDGPGADWPGCRLAVRGADYWHAARDFAQGTMCGLPFANSDMTETNVTRGQDMCPGCARVVTAALVRTGQIELPR